ncbi:uncharacterized protein [Lepeophtheirus salmonis]|uniref:Uncharacterized protein n=1 Tax=Lepeophtheirus salmonis TaxID=72036 RepID=A0A0K2V149_LEPSM|nr:uncharacterized protein LOC121119737 [Lepeophtheirus salmonis]XP_040570431.1 uncharacterized protein LOC121119737 [Lepeophtheirus salmonis]XP_040570432.1 uncharacterized protein LOC121119737 [Lepeophtheirus salmonis]XP_040570433.1 uncharacterized protein LOC121119737 [Lepeophtheirus salmonis]XP_040570434.1 uncharacterized protein LOC121119737 [Lepeophtheirus salmonis]
MEEKVEIGEDKGFLDSTVMKEEPSKPFWKKRRLWYCLLFVFVCIATVFLIGLVMYFIRLNNGTFDNEEGKDWEAKLLMDGQSSNFSGMYELVRHDENYEKYLIALGIPYFVVKLILVSPEIIIFDVPLDMKNEQWTIITKAGTDQVDHFKIDEPFIVSMRKGKTILNTIASMSSNNTLVMDSISEKSGNKLVSSFTFTTNGLINTRIFEAQNITTIKYYKKIEEETIESEKESSPFSDSEEDDLDFLKWDG